jgi:hypothetical protein
MATNIDKLIDSGPGKKMENRARVIRSTLWPDIEEEELWDRKKAAGFTTMPRTLPQLMNAIDSLTKGQPAGMTYLTLWCRLFYAGIVELPEERQMASEAGFGGERAVDTWRKRMRHLKELGFIDYQSVDGHDFQWVIVFNPHHVMRRIEKKMQKKLFQSWILRAQDVGAKDLEAPATATRKKTVTKPSLSKSTGR